MKTHDLRKKLHEHLKSPTLALFALAAVLALGVLMGGDLGLGTLINLLATGVIMDAVYKLLRFEPRDLQQEGLQETIREFRKALK